MLQLYFLYLLYCYNTYQNYFRLLKDVYRLHKDHLDAIFDDSERHKRMVELNVVEQCLNLYKTNIVQSKRFETKKNNDPEGESECELSYTLYLYIIICICMPSQRLYRLPSNYGNPSS